MSGEGLLKPEKDYTETLDEQLPEILQSAQVLPHPHQIVYSLLLMWTLLIGKYFRRYREVIGVRKTDKAGPYECNQPVLDRWNIDSI